MKNKHKLLIASIAGLIGFSVLAYLTKGTPDRQKEAVNGYINKHRNTPLINNVYLIHELENLFNYNTKAVTSADPLTSIVFRQIDTLGDGAFHYIIYPDFTSSRNGYPIRTIRYMAAIEDGILVDYQLRFTLSQENEVIDLQAIQITKKGSNILDTLVIESENYSIEQFLLNDQIEEQRSYVANLQKLEKEQKERKTLIDEQNKKFADKCLSSWNGTYLPLERHLKKYLNDPGSYEHIETVFYNKGDYALVVITYRAKNAFGGYVVNTIRGKVNWDCEFMGAIE